MLLADERMLLFAYCRNHAIAACPRCSETLTLDRIARDVIGGRRDFCPMCRTDLTDVLRRHLRECTLIRVQERELVDRSPDARPEGSNGANHRDLGSRLQPGMLGDAADAAD